MKDLKRAQNMEFAPIHGSQRDKHWRESSILGPQSALQLSLSNFPVPAQGSLSSWTKPSTCSALFLQPHTRSSLVTLACALKSYRAGEDRTLVAVYDGVFRGDDVGTLTFAVGDTAQGGRRGFRINSTQVIVAALKEISHMYSSVNYSYTLRRMIMFDFGSSVCCRDQIAEGCVMILKRDARCHVSCMDLRLLSTMALLLLSARKTCSVVLRNT
ncbi:hypothetical protein Pcac1_g20388 [Phytophthora cactorum]|nr:hypothetical protein Pcac1_g20388 [Phytophthora cactorum]